MYNTAYRYTVGTAEYTSVELKICTAHSKYFHENTMIAYISSCRVPLGTGKSLSNNQSSFGMQARRPDSHTCFFSSFCLFGDQISLFPFIFFVPFPLSLCSMDYRVRRMFFPSERCFSALWPRTGFFKISLYVIIQSINQSNESGTTLEIHLYATIVENTSQKYM